MSNRQPEAGGIKALSLQQGRGAENDDAAQGAEEQEKDPGVAAELDGPDCIAMTTLGGGSNLPEYIIHQAEMVVKKLGTGAAAVKAQNIGDAQCVFTLHYPDGRSAGMHFVQGGTPFAAAMTTGGKTAYKTVTSAFFPVLIRDMLRFFDTCKPSFDPAQTLEVNRILVAALQAADAPDTWVSIV